MVVSCKARWVDQIFPFQTSIHLNQVPTVGWLKETSNRLFPSIRLTHGGKWIGIIVFEFRNFLHLGSMLLSRETEGCRFIRSPSLKFISVIRNPSLTRYIYGTDDVQYVDFDTGVDRQSWYFVAPPSFASQDMAAAYGGTLSFTVKVYCNVRKPFTICVLDSRQHICFRGILA